MLSEGHGIGLTLINNGGFTFQLGCLEKSFTLKSSYVFLAADNFFPSCTLNDKRCQDSLGLTTETNRCLHVAKTLLIASFPIGVIALLMNVIVFAVIMSTKRLRQTPYLTLVGLLALGDTITSIYLLVVASVYQAMSLVEIETKRIEFCDYISFLLKFRNLIGMNGILFLTIERYLATVYWSKPNLKMKMKHVLLALLLSIISGLALSIWGAFDDDLDVVGFSGYVCYPIPDLTYEQYRVYAITVVTGAVLVYLAVVGMYLHIFIVARNSSRQVGIAREAKLAKRIGAVVLTNVIFAFLPFALLVVVIATGSFAGSSAEVSVGVVVGCIIILPGINSIINPVIYGYKNNKFRNVFQSRMRSLTERVNPSRQGRTRSLPPVTLLSYTSGTPPR